MKHSLTRLWGLFAFIAAFTIVPFGQALGSTAAHFFADGRLSTVNTYTAARAQSTKVVGELFAKLMMLQSSNKDILGQMEGPEGSGRPITIKTDLSKGAGDIVNFTTVSRPGGEGAIGENALEAEALDFGSYKVKVDFFRHGLGLNEKVQAFLAAGMSLEEAFAEMESEFFGLKRQNDMFVLWRRYAVALNTIRPNDRATTDTLLTADTINTTVISDASSLLKTNGAPPAKINKRAVGNFSADVKSYIILATERGLNPLKTSSSTYYDALKQAMDRGNDNLIWTGGYAPWDGNYVFHYDAINEDTKGPLSIPLQPEGTLGVALTAGTTARVIYPRSGVQSTVYWRPFKWFKGYIGTGLVGHADPSADSNDYYVIIYNMSGAAAGKYGIYKYTGSSNTGDKITSSAHLGSANAGVQVTTLAGIAYDANLHTTDHPAGSRIFQVNAKAVPYCYGVGMGAMAGLRAYGGPAIKPIKEVGDWNFKKGMGFQAIYGQNLSRDTDTSAGLTDADNSQPIGNVRNYVLIEAAYRPQGASNLPTVTS